MRKSIRFYVPQILKGGVWGERLSPRIWGTSGKEGGSLARD